MIRRAALVAALLAAPLARATYEPEETANAALVNLARRDLGAACELCRAVDPATDCARWGPEATLPVLRFEPTGADAARFHSRHMLEAPCFQHDSCCTLARDAAGVVACVDEPCSECAFPTECAGTEPPRRYELLGYGAANQGENIATGARRALEAFCAWMNSDGHRENILGAYTEIGVGRHAAPSSCQRIYWTQVLVGGTRPPDYVASAGAWGGGSPVTGNGDATLLAFVGADAPPRSVRAVLDGECVDLPAAAGPLFAKTTRADAGCHDLWFLAVAADGRRHVFPPASSMAFDPAGGACPARPARALAVCEGDSACAVESAAARCYTGPPNTEDKGTCHAGTRRCAQAAFGPCEGDVVPAAEICNGLDDDCDGETDEQPAGVGAACTTSLPGECATGITACRGGAIVCLAANGPATETCNGLDDDCDGEADDGLGVIACGEGACRRVLRACVQGVPSECRPGVPAADACGNGLDEDCDGAPDDGCACAAGDERGCYPGPANTANVGACRPGRQRCEGGAWGACAGAVLPDRETCNGVDDDCNRALDDGLGRESCGEGACRVTTASCVQGAPRVCDPERPAAEACDGEDDDCDGDVDETCGCRVGTATPCASDWGVVGVGRCRAGTRTCTDGLTFGACAGEVLPVAEICRNAIDDDCNGLVDDGCVDPPPPPDTDEPRRGCRCDTAGAALAPLALLALRRRKSRCA